MNMMEGLFFKDQLDWWNMLLIRMEGPFLYFIYNRNCMLNDLNDAGTLRAEQI